MKMLIRDHMAGVFFGELDTMDLATKTWTMRDARKIHYWRRAAAVEGVAVRGICPKDSRVTAKVGKVGGAWLVQFVEMTDEQFAALDAVPEWRP